MTPIDPHDGMRELLGAFAVDAVDPDERQLVEDHLATCPGCRSEVDALREVAGAIGTAVDPLPPALWDRIAHGLEARGTVPAPDAAIGAAPGTAIDGATGTGPAPDAAVEATGRASFAAPPAGPVPLRRRARPPVRAGWALAAAAVVAAVVLGVGWSNANSRVHSLQAAVATRGEQGAIAAALVAPGHRLVDLRNAQGVRLAQMVLLPNGRGYTVSSDMPTLPAGRTYQLWGLIDGKAISLGLLGNRAAGSTFTVALVRPSRLMVTTEPAGGVSSPDGPAVASGPVTTG